VSEITFGYRSTSPPLGDVAIPGIRVLFYVANAPIFVEDAGKTFGNGGRSIKFRAV